MERFKNKIMHNPFLLHHGVYSTICRTHMEDQKYFSETVWNKVFLKIRFGVQIRITNQIGDRLRERI